MLLLFVLKVNECVPDGFIGDAAAARAFVNNELPHTELITSEIESVCRVLSTCLHMSEAGSFQVMRIGAFIVQSVENTTNMIWKNPRYPQGNQIVSIEITSDQTNGFLPFLRDIFDFLSAFNRSFNEINNPDTHLNMLRSINRRTNIEGSTTNLLDFMPNHEGQQIPNNPGLDFLKTVFRNMYPSPILRALELARPAIVQPLMQARFDTQLTNLTCIM